MIDAPARPATTVRAPGATAAPQRSEARRALTAASVSLVAFLVLAVAVAAGWTTWLDAVGRPPSTWASARGLDPLLVDVEVVLGRAAMTAYAVSLVLALLVARAPRLAAFAGVATFGTAWATSAVKGLVARPRPEWQLAEHHHATFAFPSAHASSVTALVGVLVVVTWTLTADHPARRTITSLVSGVGLGLVVLTAADRVLLGRHYPTDVAGGTLFATLVVLLTALALGMFSRRAATATDAGIGSGPDPRALAA